MTDKVTGTDDKLDKIIDLLTKLDKIDKAVELLLVEQRPERYWLRDKADLVGKTHSLPQFTYTF